jgi:hypothetical protein
MLRHRELELREMTSDRIKELYSLKPQAVPSVHAAPCGRLNGTHTIARIHDVSAGGTDDRRLYGR